MARNFGLSIGKGAGGNTSAPRSGKRVALKGGNSTKKFTGPGKRATKSKSASIQNPGSISPPARGTRTASVGQQPGKRAVKAKSPSPTAGVVRVVTTPPTMKVPRGARSKRPAARKSPVVRK